MAKKQTFESALEELEQITRRLEEGDLSLEDSLKSFGDGVKLAEFCNKKLEEAEKKVSLLLQKDGTVKAVPFGEENEE